MSLLSLTGRAVLAAAVAAGLALSCAEAARADPSPGFVATDPNFSTLNYRLIQHEVQLGDPISLNELGLQPADAPITRRINWGDGSAIQVETKAGGWPHTYAKVGTYTISIEIRYGEQTFPGKPTSPGELTIGVVSSPPPKDYLSANYRLVPDHVRVGRPVRLAESEVHGDDGTSAVYLFRHVDWGDGSKEDEFYGVIPPPSHTYAKPGIYHVTVHLVNLQWHTAGTFPNGNTVVVTRAGGTSGSGGNAGGASGGGLPITGPGTAVLGGAGLVLVLGGAAAFALLRRRRTRFVS
jgi:hypothetical protein